MWSRPVFRRRGRTSAVAILAVLAATTAVPGLEATLAYAGPQSSRAQFHWDGPDGNALPFASEAELIEFLAMADVVDSDRIDVGVTQPRQLTLEHNGIRARAHFQDVDETAERVRLSNGQFVMELRDYYKFDCAAHELAHMLGLDNVPPLVERRVNGHPGRIQIWLENAMTEGERADRGLRPPKYLDWQRQIQTVLLFDDLIGNVDRNAGNLLIDADWKVWMIDHTRAFQARAEMQNVDDLMWVEADLWERLQSLDLDAATERLGDYLNKYEIEAMFERRDALVAHIQKLIDERGIEAVVLSGS